MTRIAIVPKALVGPYMVPVPDELAGHAGLLPTEMRRLRELEEENRSLKKIVADLTLDREMLQDVIRRKL